MHIVIINATLINLYHICHRELWLHANAIRMEHTSDIVYEGKLIGDSTYTDRAEKNKQVELNVPLPGGWMGSAKIDFFDARNRVVHETKKSDKMEQAYIAQVKFYLYLLERSGIGGARGIIEYPTLRDRTEIYLDQADFAEVEGWIGEIKRILEAETCPPVLHKPVCKQCSYYEFCYADEV